MDLIEDFDLTGHNTLRLAARARYGAFISDAAGLDELVGRSAALGLPLHILGGGSNVVLRDHIEAVVGIMAMRGRSVEAAPGGDALVTARAGEDWPSLVEWTVAEGLAGIENLAGIPGTVGAAPVQNIGAYGLELKDRFHSLLAYDKRDRTTRSFGLADCRFRYRQSVFKETDGRYVVLSVTLSLPQAWRPVLGYAGLDDLPGDVGAAGIMRRVLALRAGKLPDWRVLPNAGSFFHNPVVPAGVADAIAGGPRYRQPDGGVKLSAAWLIDACGLRGAREGDAGIYEGHALIFVNHGAATSRDVARLAERVETAVRERFGVTLRQEPIAVG